MKHKISRRKERIRIGAGISKIESGKILQQSNDTKIWLLEKIKKADKP